MFWNFVALFANIKKGRNLSIPSHDFTFTMGMVEGGDFPE